MKLNDKGFAPTLLFGSTFLSATLADPECSEESEGVKDVLRTTDEAEEETMDSVTVVVK